MLAGAPFDGPIAGLRVSLKDGKYTAFASRQEIDKSDLDLVVAGTENSIIMVEAGANEVSEDVVGKGLAWALKEMQPAIKLQKELVAKVKPAELEYELILPNEDIQQEVNNWIEGKLGEPLRKPYPERNDLINVMRRSFHDEMTEQHEEQYEALRGEYDEAFTKALHEDVRKGIVEHKTRPDGRKLDEIRPLSSEIGFLPRTHGSSIFTRGVTQAINVVTLAPLSYSQIVDTMEVSDGERRYMHHYNAPGWTVGEVRRLSGPGRREIGHGYLAERALTAVLPSIEDFSYAIRSITEIMSQIGSTSMACLPVKPVYHLMEPWEFPT